MEIEQTVQGKVVVTWAPSPDQELDDRLFYMVSQHDSNTRVWRTVADRLFSNTYTAYNIQPGREYHFRIYAKNDVGVSDPSLSPTWGVNSNRGELRLRSRSVTFGEVIKTYHTLLTTTVWHDYKCNQFQSEYCLLCTTERTHF